MELEYRDGVICITPFDVGDAAVQCEIDADSEHRHRFDSPAHFIPSEAHARRVIEEWNRERLAGTRFAFAVRWQESGALVGGCELLPKQAGIANVSYWTHPRHRGKGIAKRALRLLSQTVAARYGFQLLEVLTDVDNLASRRVAQQCGYTENGMRAGQILHILRLGEVNGEQQRV